jgi:small subunit ribosomal protein S1
MSPFTTAQDSNEMDEFEALLAEQSQNGPRKRFEVGDRVRGQVVFVGKETATLDIGNGQEALLELAEFRTKEGQTGLVPGQTVEAHVHRVAGRTIELRKGLGKGQISVDGLITAKESGVPVEGVVTAHNKGGVVVDLGQGLQGFCPFGQLDTRRVEDASVFVGQKLRFRVTDVRNKEATLSRRSVLDDESRQKALDTREKLVVGARLSGVVSSVRDFGAFVDLGGIEGLIPASELAWGKVRVADAIAAGQQVEVEILRIEASLDNKGRPMERITLSRKALAADPFEQLRSILTPGLVLQGKVVQVEAFGAFVELVAGAQGLIHISAFGKRVNKVQDVVLPQQTVVVRVLALDPNERRVSLAWVDPDKLSEILDPDQPVPTTHTGATILGIAKPQEDRRASTAESLQQAPQNVRPATRLPSRGEILEVTVDKTESFGAWVSWEGGRGLVPVSELGLAHGADVRRQVPVGSKFAALVVDVRDDNRIRLSRSQAADAHEKAEANAWLQTQRGPQVGGAGLGSLGEALLKAGMSKQR